MADINMALKLERKDLGDTLKIQILNTNSTNAAEDKEHNERIFFNFTSMQFCS